MYDSKSLQKASFDAPRAILSSDSSPLVISFNGSPSESGFNQIEILDSKNGGKSFEFHELNFAKNSAPKPSDHGRMQTCNHCHAHGSTLHPIWEAYAKWPGAYGGNDDHLSPDERKHLQAFIEKVKRDPNSRYRSLVNLDQFPSEEVIAGAPRMVARPNSRLNTRLSDRNFVRVSNLIRSTPQYGQFRYAINAALSGCMNCSSIGNYLPESVSSRFSHSCEADRSDLSSNDALHSGRDFNHFDPETTATLKYLFEGRGIGIGDWTMSLDRSSYDFSSPRGGLNDLLVQLSKDDKKISPDLSGGDCSALSKRSLAALNSIGGELICTAPPTASISLDPSLKLIPSLIPPDSLKLCIGCHTGAHPVGPLIPYDDLSLLRKRLHESGNYPHGKTLYDEIEYRLKATNSNHMPMNIDLGDQAPVIEDWFTKLYLTPSQ
jgi:hypothetical protein